MNDTEIAVTRAIDDFFDLVDAGRTPDPLEYAESLGAGFKHFLQAVEAKAALQAVIEPLPEIELPRDIGHYRVGRRLGRGASAVVYEAEDKRDGRRVALKVIHAELADQSAYVDRFRREGRWGARLRHDHLVTVYETGSIGDLHYCAMQLVEGPTLRQRLRRGALPATPDVLAQFAGLADGLSVLHDAGIVHRDVNPSNILIGPDGRFLLTDFGLIRAPRETTLTRSGEALGTFGYMSPEQLCGKRDELDARTDIYALGATLYEAFCGRRAWDAASLDAVLRPVHEPGPPDPRVVEPGLPAALSDVIMTAMERRPEDRYPSSAALSEDLRRLAQGREVSGRPVPAVRRFLRDHRLLAGLAAGLVVALVGYGVHLRTRPARLELECTPPASVLVDGVLLGQSPLVLELDPGRHEIVCELDKFRRQSRSLDLVRGPNGKRTIGLLPVSFSDAEAMRALFRALGYEVDQFELGAERGGDGYPIGRALLPAGRCRPEDLVVLRFETADEALPMPARLVIRRGEQVLHSEVLNTVDLVEEYPFPASVRDGLHEGDSITWGVVDGGGRAFETTVEVVGETAELRTALERVDGALAQAPAPVRAFLRAQAFRKEGMFLAGHLEASRTRDGGPLTLGGSLQTLRDLGVAASRLGDSLRDEIAALPPETRDAWFR